MPYKHVYMCGWGYACTLNNKEKAQLKTHILKKDISINKIKFKIND